MQSVDLEVPSLTAESRAEGEKLLAKAREIVVGHQRGSISLVQRMLKIRYTQAADLLVELERQGVVGPIKGNGGREVLVLPWPVERRPAPGQQWKCGDEFLPFHPQASHIPPDYRDGWNRCYWMAVRRETQEQPLLDSPPSDRTGPNEQNHSVHSGPSGNRPENLSEAGKA